MKDIMKLVMQADNSYKQYKLLPNLNNDNMN